MIPRTKPIPRRSRPRRQRRGKNASLGREADRLWSLIVRSRGSCEERGCGSTERLQAAHGFSRRYRGTRWLPINGFCLCARHHVYYTHRALEWDQELRIAWGEAMYENLRATALWDGKHTTEDLEGRVKALREEASKLGIL